MKKVFTYVTVLAAIAMLTMVTMTSCKDKKDPYDVANGILSRDWQGYIQDQKETRVYPRSEGERLQLEGYGSL